jgi:multiple antibiotic resistance protein
MFDKNAEIVLRLNGFIVGAYGVDLIVVGVQNIIG